MTERQVVLAEDDADVRGLVVRTLDEEFAVESFADGRACWERLQSGPRPDVLLLDVSLPHVDGLELYERVRENDRLSTATVLFLTGQEEAEVPDGAGYVAKPFSPSELLERVRQAG
ncbi:response regulator [Halobacteriales archaeon QS_9_68_42]|nr:MAG: response regulator [Halobacteriales archaeon QS_9_68_42]